MHNTAADWKMQELANPSSAEDLRASPIKEKRLGRFSTPDFINQIRATRDLQRVRSTKFPAQELCASPIKEKRLGRFSTPDFINQIRAASACVASMRYFPYQLNATSSTIMSAKPTANPIVQTSVLSSRVASGMSSSMTT